MPAVGEMRDRVRLERRGDDANGDPLGEWDVAAAPVRWAKISWLRGGEGVQQQRLQGNQPVLIEVRDDSATRSVDNAWRAVQVQTVAGVVTPVRTFNITAISPSKDRAFREILAIWDGKGG